MLYGHKAKLRSTSHVCVYSKISTSLAGCQKLNLIYFYLKKHWCRVGSLPGSSNLSFLLQIHSQPLLWTRPNHLSLAFPAFIFITSSMRRSYRVLIPKVFPSRSLFHWTTAWTRLSPPFRTFHFILADSLLSHIQIQRQPKHSDFYLLRPGSFKRSIDLLPGLRRSGAT